MVESAKLFTDQDRSWILSQAEYDELVGFRERTMAVIRRLLSDDNDALERMRRLLQGSVADTGQSIDLMLALNQALDERDRAREAAERLRRLTAKGDSYTLALLEGRA